MIKSQHLSSIRLTGLIIFLISLCFFIGLLGASRFQLQKSSLENMFSGEKENILTASLQPILETEFTSKIEFIFALRSAFNLANSDILSHYSVSDKQIADLVSAVFNKNSGVFSQSMIKAAIGVESPFQRAKLIDYTQWMENKSFGSSKDLLATLSKTQNDINNNIVFQKGFDSQTIDNAIYTLVYSSTKSIVLSNTELILFFTLFLGVFGSLFYIYPQKFEGPAGIKHNGIFKSSTTNRGLIGIILGTALISFYILLYQFPEFIIEWIRLVDPISYALNGGPASRWFLYGLLYTLAILVMGVRMLIKYQGNKYQQVRSLSVMFFQTTFAFLFIQIMQRLNMPAVDLKNIWPLDYSFFFEYRINELIANGHLGLFMLVWGIALFLIGVPVLTYFFGKRWYCSWVCGCGGLAETLGDPFRQLSDKSTQAWKVERWMIHSVFVFAILMTAGVIYTYFTTNNTFLGVDTYWLRSQYGFLIGSVFSGIVGTGFYPLMGNRVWCRFGCPLAAYLGFVQRFKSRFRITTNGGQCISCGNCSTYCEMGIDVRAYAQRGQDIVRSSCVGCGVCASVCPRGVLKLENGTVSLDESAI
jgi:Pyruvate/2-oxoacid:ferredoxin oxidoreductase delta subunit